MAADLPMRSPPPAPFYPAPIFTWTGFYAGVNAGASFDNKAGSATANGFTAANGFVGGPATGSFGPFRGGSSSTGFVGGGQIGYNIQNGMFVYGLEADIDYFGGGGGKTRSYADNVVFPGGTLTTRSRGGDGYLGTVRGRLGVAAFDRTLLYVTGGLAYGDYGTSTRSARFTNATGTNFIDFNGNGNDDTRIGYAVGAGVEYAFTQQISGKIEYLYTDLGSRKYNLTNPNTGAVISARSDGTSQIARVGLNYKF
ncbi:outer membrane beta-barrel protein [Lichenihabitans sp. PAMC28606]|uniref:outer membrane protein n=1 Tax=Lichenihabitans sp. PAMC28606 TaxID=2880932 RepID=UPI001D0B236E|nr:outer membrane beta-barrel protein [Lichenihabitans sp. PAMC28606]UDL95198.1 outer membrane beta-barrel protein [Lichenihabitans sp. PAMC28606]